MIKKLKNLAKYQSKIYSDYSVNVIRFSTKQTVDDKTT